jgi:hypothetical protein
MKNPGSTDEQPAMVAQRVLTAILECYGTAACLSNERNPSLTEHQARAAISARTACL